MSEPSYYDMVFEVTRQVPRGRVTTYGAIADYLALGSARMVGWALNKSFLGGKCTGPAGGEPERRTKRPQSFPNAYHDARVAGARGSCSSG